MIKNDGVATGEKKLYCPICFEEQCDHFIPCGQRLLLTSKEAKAKREKLPPIDPNINTFFDF